MKADGRPDEQRNDPLIVFGAIIVAAIWIVGTNWRSSAMLSREAEHRLMADRSIRAQEAAEHRLAIVNDQFGELNRRLAAIEGVLKDAE